uniref:Uncharacterized protein n=1 Tax=Arundo donax TaxID=35708 RepID=A0A0A9DHU3_ARUDO
MQNRLSNKMLGHSKKLGKGRILTKDGPYYNRTKAYQHFHALSRRYSTELSSLRCNRSKS